MYSDRNFKTKKAFKEAVEAGDKIRVFQPGPFGGGDYSSGKYCVEGPWDYHKWYASVVVKDGYVISVK